MPPTIKPATAGPPGSRRRNPQSHQAILTATLELLEEVGYFGTSIEAIARRAGVGKKTIYRWWPSKAVVVMEAYAALTKQMPPPDTDSVKADLQHYLQQLFTVLTTTSAGAAMAGIMAEAQTNADLAQTFRQQFIIGRRAAMQVILERGVARGELRPNLDLECVIDTLYGPMWYRLLVGHQPLNQEFAEVLIEQLISGLRVH